MYKSSYSIDIQSLLYETVSHDHRNHRIRSAVSVLPRRSNQVVIAVLRWIR